MRVLHKTFWIFLFQNRNEIKNGAILRLTTSPVSYCSVLLSLQSEDLISKPLWTDVCTLKFSRCIPQSSCKGGWWCGWDDSMWCSLFLSYRGSGGISEWHLVIGLAQLGAFCLSLLFPGNSFHVQDVSPSLLAVQPHSSCSFSIPELRAKRKGWEWNHWELCWAAQVGAFLLSGFLLSGQPLQCWDFTVFVLFFIQHHLLASSSKNTTVLLVAL